MMKKISHFDQNENEKEMKITDEVQKDILDFIKSESQNNSDNNNYLK